MYAKLNKIKTVSLNELSVSTKSGGQISSRQMFNHSYKGPLSQTAGNYFHFKHNKQSCQYNERSHLTAKSGYWRGSKNQKSMMLNLSGNNNSISSLKLNDRNHLIEDVNNSRIDTFYSPMNRERSNTTESIYDAMLNKWKSSNSLSSNEQISASYHKKPDISNTPYRNIYSSTAKYNEIYKLKPDLIDPMTSLEERCETLETSSATFTK